MQEVDREVVVDVTRLYARQSRLIDEGDAAGWAATFVPEGSFHSPSYPQPVLGAAALQAFAEDFARGGRESRTVSRHVVTTIDVLPGLDADHVVAHAYLQIVSTPAGEQSRLVRLTTVRDELVRTRGHWRFATRAVTRDDTLQPLQSPTRSREETA